jgi:cytochrome b6-f complex iron-sulfur subunit
MAIVETFGMDNPQQPEDVAPDSGSGEKPKVTAAPKAPQATADKPSAAKAGVGSSAGARSKTVESEQPDPVNKVRRRITWVAIGGFLSLCFMMFLRFFLPRTILEPKETFSVGYPSDFGIGVETKFQQQYRVWVVRNAQRIFVIYAKCPHLGCTPDWKPAENKFKCPCHGSGYDSEGINFEGPAPRPMDRARVELDATGQMIVNTAKLYQQPKGERSQFDDEGAFLSA